MFVHKQLQVFSSVATIVEPLVDPIDHIDPNDWPILGTALAGKAHVLVTGDQRVLAAHTYHDTPIITPRSFLNQLEGLNRI